MTVNPLDSTVVAAMDALSVADGAVAITPVVKHATKFEDLFDFDRFTNASSICRSMLHLLQLDDNGIDTYLKDTVGDCKDVEMLEWLRLCTKEDIAGRRNAIFKQAIASHILYNYCDVIYVLNPYVVNVDSVLKPVGFAKSISKLFQVVIEVVLVTDAKTSIKQKAVAPLRKATQSMCVRSVCSSSIRMFFSSQLNYELMPNLVCCWIYSR